MAKKAPPVAPSLFEAATAVELHNARPLADRLRPQSLTEVQGQDHLLCNDGALGRIAKGEAVRSMIFWGPPGTGKTTVAHLVAKAADLHFEQLSAILSGVHELRTVFAAATDRRAFGKGTLLFVDEIHRFNRSQQDSFLPFLEDGTIVLIGATTENPSFEINGALLSRVKVMTFRRLEPDDLAKVLQRAEQLEGNSLPVTSEARAALVRMADGDARAALNLAEDIFASSRDVKSPLDEAALAALVQRRAPLYDKSRDQHYGIVSALHKSVRGSDPDAALYWFCRMVDGGEDPLYIARRLVRMAVEDIGLADPQALLIANAAKDAYDFLGSPEGELALAQCVVYLATAPKSNAVYRAYKTAMRTAKDHGSLPPPKHILNAPTRFMEEEGFGVGYLYDHDEAGGISRQSYFPEALGEPPAFYEPTHRGSEIEIGQRLANARRHRNDDNPCP